MNSSSHNTQPKVKDFGASPTPVAQVILVAALLLPATSVLAAPDQSSWKPPVTSHWWDSSATNHNGQSLSSPTGTFMGAPSRYMGPGASGSDPAFSTFEADACPGGGFWERGVYWAYDLCPQSMNDYTWNHFHGTTEMTIWEDPQTDYLYSIMSENGGIYGGYHMMIRRDPLAPGASNDSGKGMADKYVFRNYLNYPLKNPYLGKIQYPAGAYTEPDAPVDQQTPANCEGRNIYAMSLSHGDFMPADAIKTEVNGQDGCAPEHLIQTRSPDVAVDEVTGDTYLTFVERYVPVNERSEDADVGTVGHELFTWKVYVSKIPAANMNNLDPHVSGQSTLLSGGNGFGGALNHNATNHAYAPRITIAQEEGTAVPYVMWVEDGDDVWWHKHVHVAKYVSGTWVYLTGQGGNADFGVAAGPNEGHTIGLKGATSSYVTGEKTTQTGFGDIATMKNANGDDQVVIAYSDQHLNNPSNTYWIKTKTWTGSSWLGIGEGESTVAGEDAFNARLATVDDRVYMVFSTFDSATDQGRVYVMTRTSAAGSSWDYVKVKGYTEATGSTTNVNARYWGPPGSKKARWPSIDVRSGPSGYDQVVVAMIEGDPDNQWNSWKENVTDSITDAILTRAYYCYAGHSTGNCEDIDATGDDFPALFGNSSGKRVGAVNHIPWVGAAEAGMNHFGSYKSVSSLDWVDINSQDAPTNIIFSKAAGWGLAPLGMAGSKKFRVYTSTVQLGNGHRLFDSGEYIRGIAEYAR